MFVYQLPLISRGMNTLLFCQSKAHAYLNKIIFLTLQLFKIIVYIFSIVLIKSIHFVIINDYFLNRFVPTWRNVADSLKSKLIIIRI